MKNLTYMEIQQEIRKLQNWSDEIRAKEIADVIADIKAKIQLYGITEKDLGFGEKQKKEIFPPLYKKGNQTWSGRGRQPKWIKEHLEAGGNLEDLLV
ncbi:H-NS histone family protein [Nitrosomonas sp.]|uniref:H-NS histone family protein n=2 Tax=Nitrosomonas sp. TaxID=42353 RepID=UPI0033060A0B